MFRVFLRHEIAMQIRSARFHGMSLAYLLISTVPAFAEFMMSRGSDQLISSATFGASMDAIQPLATMILAAAIAVDAVARERDENSLAVVAIARISATGYVLRRWLAVLVLLIPVTLLPRMIAIGLAARAIDGIPDSASILLGWAMHVLPLLVVATALAQALGTITNRAVLALLFGFGLFTFGLGIANDLLAHVHRRFDGPEALFGFEKIQLLIWNLEGYGGRRIVSEAGYPLAREFEELRIQIASFLAISAIFLGLSCAYLRRTRRDVRPWRIGANHPLRTFLRTVNRIREEYTPDGGLEIPELVAIASGLLFAIALFVMMERRYENFERLAIERYAAETADIPPMPVSIIPTAASFRGLLRRGGELHGVAVVTVRNDGAAARDVTFVLNRGIAIQSVSATRGTTRVRRVWEKVGVRLDPVLNAGETRALSFVLRGAPGTFDFNLPSTNSFGASWRRYAAGTSSFEIADLSRSLMRRDASGERIDLSGPSLFPTPRYSPWQVQEPGPRWEGDAPMQTFVPEEITPQTDLEVDLGIEAEVKTIDSCGTIASRHLVSRCQGSIAGYQISGARFEIMALSGDRRLAYLPRHGRLARLHTTAIDAAVALAKKVWPGFTLTPRAVFVERATWPHEQDIGSGRIATIRAILSHGSTTLIPEPMFIHLRPLDRGSVAAALIRENLASRRPVLPEQNAFFLAFYETLASWRTGGRKPDAIEGPIGAPYLEPIIGVGMGNYWNGPVRLQKILVDLEARIGADRLREGVDDFLRASRSQGNAKELLDAIGRRGRISLDGYYRDYFLGREIPRLTLADVAFIHGESSWEVRGLLKNENGGEVSCPLVLRTAGGAIRTLVDVGAHSSSTFVLAAEQEPRTLQLDPERVVYRHAAVGTIEAVDYKPLSQ
jgi:ABC-type transport system involved in multi-copper enzyme maturation permease subunit